MQKDTLLQIVKDQNKLLEAFKTNNEAVLKSIYQENYAEVQHYIMKNSGGEQEAKDIYQEAFLAFWNNIKNDKFKSTSNSSLNGYLYTIAKNKWLDYLRSSKHKKMISTSKLNNLDLEQVKSEFDEESDENDQKLERAMKSFNLLGEACKLLLTKVYFEKKSMKEIAIELELDAASTRNKKYRCMQKLRELALKK